MKVKVSTLCTGHGRCYVLHSSVYQADDLDGYNKYRGEEFDVAPADESEARKGEAVCPERAITIE